MIAEFDGQLGRDVLALLDVLDIPNVHFVGLSMGGLIGQWLGIHAGKRLYSLTLCNTAAKISNDGVWNTRINTVLKGGQKAMADLRDASIARWFTPAFAQAQPEQARRICQMVAQTSAQGYAASCAAVRDAAYRQQLGAIQVPTLIVAGSEDVVTTPEHGRLMQNAIQGAQYAEFRAAHLSNVEIGEPFTARILDFLLAR